MNKQTDRQVSCVMQGDNIHLFIDGECYVVNAKTHLNYDAIVKALGNNDHDTLAKLVDMKKAFETYASADGSMKVEVRNDAIYVNDKILHDALGNRLFEMARQRLPVQPMIEFLAKKAKNRSKRAIGELFGMLEHNILPITPRGTFQAYKAVKRHAGTPFVDPLGRRVKFNDLVDIYTGKYRNNVGDEVSMDRDDVCDDKSRTCAKGLHFTSLGYITKGTGMGRFTGKSIVIIEIDPADVVSIPVDYSNQKGRCCQYKVVHLHTEGDEFPEEAFDSPISNIGFEVPDGPRWRVVSTNKDNEGDLVKAFKKRSKAREYGKEFSDTKIVDSWAVAKLTAVNEAADAEDAKKQKGPSKS